MKEKFLNTDEAPNKWFAAYDARMRSIANQTTFSQAQQVQAERMHAVMEMVYSGRVFTPKYNKTMITLKIENPVVKDKKNLKLLETEWEKSGVRKRVTAQGINYNILKV